MVRWAVEYWANNRELMHYDHYLAAGSPIGSGVAEGACRHLVKDRLEQTGMRWTVEGARAMLQVRALYLNGQWGELLERRTEREQSAGTGRLQRSGRRVTPVDLSRGNSSLLCEAV